MAHVAEIWRHPIKSHGRERIDQVALTQGKPLPWDRRWAVAHAASRFDPDRPRWEPCSEFSIGAKSLSLQGISCQTQADGRLTLRHPARPDLTFAPDDPADAAAFIDWVQGLSNPDRPAPARLVRAAEAMTDTDYQSISLINLASHRAVEAQLGQQISPLRWRGNLLIDGWEAWAETSLIGRRLRIGGAELEVMEPIRRCNATTASPDTGEKDANTLAALRDGFGHQDCGVYLVVLRDGPVQTGDPVEIL